MQTARDKISEEEFRQASERLPTREPAEAGLELIERRPEQARALHTDRLDQRPSQCQSGKVVVVVVERSGRRRLTNAFAQVSERGEHRRIGGNRKTLTSQLAHQVAALRRLSQFEQHQEGPARGRDRGTTLEGLRARVK